MGNSCKKEFNNFEIKVPGKYIIMKKDSNGILLEQYAYISKENNGRYEYDYGYFQNHEGTCNSKEIRELTSEEIEKSDNCQKWYNLPQDFYQSPP